jgi:rare lipoprotein A (peptidoglycan hydrolase)
VTVGSAGTRAATLAAVALVAIAVALALSHHSTPTSALPLPAGDWYTALAAPYTPSKGRTKSACGVTIDTKVVGVAHPVLPCGVKLYVEYKGKQVLTQVVDRGHTVPGRVFDLTEALARLLNVQGTQTIQWRFAR